MTLESGVSTSIGQERSLRNAFFDSACVGHLVLTKALVVVDANTWICDWIGRDAGSLCGVSDIRSLLTVGGRILFETHLAPMLALDGDVAEAALDFRSSSGARLPALVNIARRPVDDEDYIFVSVSPAANRLAYEQEVIRSRKLAEQGHRRLRDVLESASDMILMADQDHVVTYANENARTALGLVSVEGVALVDLMAGTADGAIRSSIADTIASRDRRRFEHFHKASRRWLEIDQFPTEDGLSVFMRDVTDRKALEQDRARATGQIEHAATHDMLTGLKNRMGFTRVLEARLERPGLQSGFAVLLVDLDRFKSVNDTFGHAAGDALLKMVSMRMLSCVRSTDVVARLGGDEFAILCCFGDDPREAAVTVAARLLVELSETFDFEGKELVIGASIGIALAPDHGSMPDVLMQAADAALYDVKYSGRNALKIFDERLQSSEREKRLLEFDLRSAIQNGELSLTYQPIVAVRTRQPVGMEALLRWNHPSRGMISPSIFIPIAEQSGQMRAIGRWVARQALADAARWPRHLGVAINLSPVQLAYNDVVEVMTTEASRSGIDPKRVEIEVTESVLLGDNEALVAQLHQLRALGFRIALDDFGTGYSSLSYIKRFPFDKIKIDRTFVDDLDRSRDSAAIVAAVISLGRSLGVSITAEGVETEEQLQLLTALQCDTVQGFLFGRPKPAVDVLAAMDRWRGSRSVAATRSSGSRALQR
jgi:diguanylate cyclase (GGDEF)-like protein/PAS domain S-box-containing protein